MPYPSPPLVFCLACWLLPAKVAAGDRVVALGSLLEEMVDRDAVARFPDPAYTTGQASSYDRQSVAPDKPGWFANNDWSQFIRSEKHADRTEWVMMDGYAYGSNLLFSHPFHAQTRCDGPASKGFTCITRERLLDGITFEKSLRFDLEVWHWVQARLAVAATSYWYARPGATFEPSPQPNEVVRPLPALPAVGKLTGVIEAEGLEVLEKTGGQTSIQRSAELQWSGGAQLCWQDAKVGDRLVLALPVETAGTYNLPASLTRAPEYGTVQFSLDGQKLRDPINLYSPRVQTPDPVSVGRTQLTAGVHRLAVQIVGSDPDAVPGHVLGIDYLKLVPVP